MPATETPITIGSITFPKLTIRTTSAVASKKKALDLAALRSLATEEKMLPENKARFLALTVTADYGRYEVRDWATSCEGAQAICRASLVQGGRTEADAAQVVEVMDPDDVCDAALEIVNHPQSPRNVAARQLAPESVANPQ